MSSRSSHRMSVARHVYLRTQQRRLRHVTSVVIRNLTLAEVNSELSADPISMETHFTVHPVSCPDKVLYKSFPVQKSYNPSWEAVQFDPQQYEKYSAISSFVLKLWMRVGSNNELVLVFEKKIDLPSLAYLGTLVNKGNSPYPPNSVVVGMFEGYYSHPGVGGVPCPPKITHALEKLLPPQSLLEVNKLEVRDSYMCPRLLELIDCQEQLNKATTEATQAHSSVDSVKATEEVWVGGRSQRELVRMRVAILRSQLVEKEREEAEERNQLCKLQNKLDIKEKSLSEAKADLMCDKQKYREDYEAYCKKREMLIRARRNQLLRQKNMISEAAFTFFITELKDKFTICNVLLQNSDQLDQPSSVEQPGVALGYVAHLVHHLAQILLIPLQYEIHPNGSRSLICDYISDEAIIDDIREFPLYLKGVERALFHYAVHLLNKDIAQIRQHCGYGMSKSMLKKTLPNLKLLLDKIISELSMTPSKNSLSRLSLPTTPIHTTPSAVAAMAVPSGGHRNSRERQEVNLTPSTCSTPRIESEVYSSSPVLEGFQPSEDGGSSRPASPAQPSHDSASVESNDHMFHKLEQSDVRAQTNIPILQKYPAMQSDMTERHYPIIPNRHSTSFPVFTTVSSSIEHTPFVPHSIAEHSSSPMATSTPHRVSSQSFVHADLHRVQHSEQLEPSEELASVGTAGERNSTATVPHSDLTQVQSHSTTTFMVGTGNSSPSLQSIASEWEQDEAQTINNGQQKDQTQSVHSQEQSNSPSLYDYHDLNHTLIAGQVSQVNCYRPGSPSKPTVNYVEVYHPSLPEAGYSVTALATPHKITSNNYDNHEKKISKKSCETTSNSGTDGQLSTGLLEHFIDNV